jgi:signal transduction histidine kinase
MNRVGLLMPPGRNRDLLADTLRGGGLDVTLIDVDPHTATESDLDLVVADAVTLDSMLARSTERQAVDLPPTVLLVRSAEQRGLPVRLRVAADEIITIPVGQEDLMARVRRLAARHGRAAEERRRIREEVAHINHELRTPLQSVLAYTELLDPAGLSAEQAALRDRINRGGQRMLELVNVMLDFERMRSGHLDLDPASVDLARAVAEALAEVRPLAQRRGIAVRVRPPEGSGLAGYADRAYLNQILLNLITNAVKYNTENGGIDIGFRAAGDMVAVDVSDTGPGIAPGDLERIFQPYERLASSLNALGTGLGLPYARTLAERMGGQLVVSSQVGQGSTFTLELPRP